MAELSAGVTFEARAHRLFLAQGSFAERGLLPTATPDRRMLAADIDVLVSEYGSGFHLTRRHVECKSGRFPLLDRILWLNGVRTLLSADSSYLIAADVDLSASEFARTLDVQLFTGQHLDAWEKSLGIPADAWPCRSDFAAFDAARATWKRLSSDRSDDVWRSLRGALSFIEVESWLTFRYRQLNKLFRLISEISKAHDTETLDRDQQLCAQYVFSALVVRLAQYVLAICADVGGIMPLDIERYLIGRLTFGDLDPTQVASLTSAAVTWVRESLHVRGITMPNDVDPARLNVPPPYAAEVVSLVRRLLEHSHEARYLPLAVERMQFGLEADEKLSRFRVAGAFAESLAALLKAFVARAFKVSTALAAPVHADLIDAYKGTGRTPASAPAGGKTPQRSGRSKLPPRKKGKDSKTPPASPAPEQKDSPVKTNADSINPDQPRLMTIPAEEKE